MAHDESFQHKLWELIKEIRFALLTHKHADGTLHAHPLTTHNKSLHPGETLNFFVSKKTEIGQRLRNDGNVCVAYADPKKDIWVSITGHATINEDKARKHELFNALDKAWFPGGADDADLELVEIELLAAEYWDVKESKPTQLLKMAAAAVSGVPPKMGEHAEMRIAKTDKVTHE